MRLPARFEPVRISAWNAAARIRQGGGKCAKRREMGTVVKVIAGGWLTAACAPTRCHLIKLSPPTDSQNALIPAALTGHQDHRGGCGFGWGVQPLRRVLATLVIHPPQCAPRGLAPRIVQALCRRAATTLFCSPRRGPVRCELARPAHRPCGDGSPVPKARHAPLRSIPEWPPIIPPQHPGLAEILTACER